MLIFLIAIHVTHSDAEPLLFAIVGVKEESSSFRAIKLMATAIAQRCSTEIRLIELPPKREIEYFLSGELDGSVASPGRRAENTPELIKVLEPTATFPVYAYAKNADISIDGWDSLKNYRVAYIEGLMYGEPNNSRKKDNDVPFNDVPFNDVAGGLRFVESGRADVFVHSPFGVESLLRSGEFKNSGIVSLQPALDIFSTYIFVLSKHAELAECFNIALKNMKKDKSYEKILGREFLGN